ncbi:hypothetical protein C8R46DRAFT_1096480 [Mycena filopes]|nr:hypothetical protein C8R46DRAFT_1096480 [Mycena filopes]
MTAGVDDLRKRICEIASAIQTHKDAIHELEQTKSEVQGDLNAILDPIARLPLEISSDIFLQSRPSIPSCDPDTAPLVFLRVCRAWSNIALSTSSLWSTVCIDSQFSGRFGFLGLSETWITRAQGHPLSVFITGFLNSMVADMLRRHVDRLHTLKLALVSQQELPLIWMPFPSLRSLTISHRAVDSGRYGQPEYHVSFDLEGCVDLLCAAPKLVECTIVDVYPGPRSSASGPHPSSFSRHPTLKHLRLGNENGRICTAQLLDSLTLPALESLSLSSFDLPSADFVAFLTRSSPPLTSLVLLGESTWATDSRERLFLLLPRLVHLEVKFHRPELFEFLVVRALGELPTLRSLHVREYTPDRAEFGRLVSALSARTTMRSFRLVWTPSTGIPYRKYDPDPGAIASLQRIAAANRVEIHVGPEGSNLV